MKKIFKIILHIIFWIGYIYLVFSLFTKFGLDLNLLIIFICILFGYIIFLIPIKATIKKEQKEEAQSL